jgi:hypothetical protein
MSVSETLSVVSGLPGFRELGPLMVRELRVELADVRRLRAVLDGRLVDIVRRIEESTREVGTHERGASEASMGDNSSNPDTRSVAVQSSGILSPASWPRLDTRSISVQSSESFSPVSPCRRARRPHRRMDRICSSGSTMSVVMRGGNDGTVLRVASVSKFSTDVCGEVCPSVPHPLGTVLP